MATGTAEQNVGTTGGSGGSGVVGWRDAYTNLGAMELLNNLGASTSSATSGNISYGDRIIGGSKKNFQFGLVKMLAFGALVAIVLKIWKGKK